MRIGSERSNASAMGIYGLLAIAVALLSLFMLLQKPTEAALPPSTMNFQGRLADSSGNLMPDGLYNMQFRLFSVSSGGSAVWTETRENNGTDRRVQVTNGLFSTQLGEANPLSASLFNATDLYFEITMATPATANCSTASCASWETPMTPRQKLATSAYAFNSATLNGKADTDFGQLAVSNTWTGTNSVRVTSATAFRVQNAGGTTLLAADTSNMRTNINGDLDVSGRGAYGNNGTLGDSDPDTTSVLSVEQNITSVTNDIDDIGINGSLTVNPNINPAAGTSFIGVQGSVVIDPSNTTDTTNAFFTGGKFVSEANGSGDVNSVVGVSSFAGSMASGTTNFLTGGSFTASNIFGSITQLSGNIIIASNAGGAVDTMHGQSITLDQNFGGTINTAVGLNIEVLNTGGTLTDAAGIVIDEVAGTDATNLLIGTTTIPNGSDYSIYSASTRESYFAGAITVNDDLTVNGGSTLRLVGGNTASRPASPTEGMVYYDTDTNQLLTYANGKWQSDAKTATVIVAASDSSQAVKDGADYIADGTADQTEINAALTAASGGVVYLAQGTFEISGAITMTPGTTLAGSGQSTSGTILSRAANFAGGLIDFSSDSNAAVRDMRLDGQKATYTTTTNDGISASGEANNITLQKITVTGFAGRGIDLEGTGNKNDFKLRNSTITSNDSYGVLTDASSTDASIANNTISNNTNGVLLQSNTSHIADNTLASNTTDGILLNCQACSVTGNNIRSNGDGLDTGGLTTVGTSVAGNTFVSNTRGILAGAWNTSISGNTFGQNTNAIVTENGGFNNINGNNFILQTGHAILLNGGTSTEEDIVTNNMFEIGSVAFDGIRTNDADNAVLTNNKIVNNGSGSAITIGAASNGVTLSGNTFGGSGSTISDNGTNTRYNNQQLNQTGNVVQRVADSTNAFAIQNAAGSDLFVANTTNSRIQIGTADSTGTVLVLDSKTTAGDPTAVNGGMYYNSNTNKFRCYENSAWVDCIASASGYIQNGSSPQTGNFNITGTGTIGTSLVVNGTAQVQTTSATALSVQNAGSTSLLVANTSAMTVTIGSGANTMTLSQNGVTLAGNARATVTETLAPEYAGATFTGDGSNNIGSLSSDFCSGSSRQNINPTACGATETRNYYQWTTTEATAQDYDLYVRYQIPSNYSSGSMTNLRVQGWGTTSASESVTVALISDGSATPCSTSSNAISSNATWGQATVASPLGACSIAAGDTVTFKVHVVAGQDNITRAGAISFSYRSTF